MKKVFFSLLLVACLACTAAPAALAEDFEAGGGSPGSGGAGRDDVSSSESSSMGSDDALSFGGEMKDSVDKYGDGLNEGIDAVKDFWEENFDSMGQYSQFLGSAVGSITKTVPMYVFYITLLFVLAVVVAVVWSLTN